jgi:hypothetical protein
MCLCQLLDDAPVTVRGIVVCTIGRFTAGHTQRVCTEYYDLKWHEFVFYAIRGAGRA